MRLFITLWSLLWMTTAWTQNCSVTITSITGIGPGNPPPAVHIQVDGKVSSQQLCSRVEITLCCKDRPASCRTQATTVRNDNTWSTLFKDFICPCEGGKFIVIAKAICLSDPNCMGADMEATIICDQPAGCPSILDVMPSIGNCVNDPSGCQLKEVTFTPTISGPVDAYMWNFGDNTNSSGVGTPGPQTHGYAHYPQSTPTLTIFRAGCVPITFNINLPAFSPCAACPVAAQVNLNNLTVSGCQLTGLLSGSFCTDQFVSYIIDFDDGSSSPTIPIAQFSTNAVNHTYECNGSYQVKVTLVDNISSCSFTRTIVVNNCSTCEPNEEEDEADDCTFCVCGISFWCCILYILLIIALIAMGLALAYALCSGGTPAWIAFGIALAAVIALLLWLYFKCDLGICDLILAIAVAGTLDSGILCATSLIPCSNWLCQKVTLPILGPTQHYFIVAIVLWLLVLLCRWL